MPCTGASVIKKLGVMWTCPECNEQIEDQFDSCWKCAGRKHPALPETQNYWLYPFCSFWLLALWAFISPAFVLSRRHELDHMSAAGTILSVLVALLCLLAFA